MRRRRSITMLKIRVVLDISGINNTKLTQRLMRTLTFVLQ